MAPGDRGFFMRFPIILIIQLLFVLQACNTDASESNLLHGKLPSITVVIQPFEEFIPDAVAYVAAGIKDSLGVEVKVLPEAKLPRIAWYPPTKRYKADTVLNYLKPLSDNSLRYVLGITGKDIATNKNGNPYWGIMGLGLCPGHCCIISDYRLHRYPQTNKQLNTRLLKVALHELGHNFGLPHCVDQSCLMVDAEGKDKIDGEKTFCGDCEKKLSKILEKFAQKF